MPKKGYRKPGSVADQKELKQRTNKAVQGLDKTMDAINDRLDKGLPLTDEQIRFVKRYGDIRQSIMAKEEPTDKKGLRAGALKVYIEREWKLSEIRTRSGYSRDRDGYEQVLTDFGLFRCDTCGEMHPTGLVCPFDQLASKLEEPIKAPTDKDLDSLL